VIIEMAQLTPILTKEEIDRIISSLANRISSDYQGCDLVLIGVLKGAFIFMADLVRKLTIPVTMDFVGATSYGKKTVSSGSLRFTKAIEIDVRDKDVVLVDDIVDTGLTMACLVTHVKAMGPKSVKVCTLIDKKERREQDIFLDYIGVVVENGFLAGFGLDYAEAYRNLPGIFQLNL